MLVVLEFGFEWYRFINRLRTPSPAEANKRDKKKLSLIVMAKTPEHVL